MFLVLLAIGWLAFNIAFVIPCAILIFYTANTVFPIFASVEDLDAPIYQSLDLGRVVDEDADGTLAQPNKNDSRPRATSSSIRSMTQLLFSDRKFFSFCRGIGWLWLWNMVKGLAQLPSQKLPSALGFLFQILLPVAFVQLHTLWVHTVIAPSSPKPFRHRFLPFKTAFRTVGPPMLLFLTAESITQRILLHVYRSMEMKWEDFTPMGNFQKFIVFGLLLAVLSLVIVVPTQLLLVRVEASLLPVDEQTVIPLDPALNEIQEQREHMAFVEVAKSLTRARVVNLVFLYLRVFLITGVAVVVVGSVDFLWYIWVALHNWRF